MPCLMMQISSQLLHLFLGGIQQSKKEGNNGFGQGDVARETE